MIQIHTLWLSCSMVAMATWFILSTPSATAREPGPIWSRTFAPDEAGLLQVRFVRGTAEIRRRPGPIVIIVHKQSEAGKESSVSIRVTASDGGTEVTDIYPPLWMPMWHECLPVDAGRGDFWNSDLRLRTIVLAPEEATIDIHFMDGGKVIDK